MSIESTTFDHDRPSLMVPIEKVPRVVGRILDEQNTKPGRDRIALSTPKMSQGHTAEKTILNDRVELFEEFLQIFVP